VKPAPLIAFVGTTPNIGVTSAAFAFAYRTAEASGKPVGFLCMNLKSAKIHRFLGMDGPSSTLDGLRPELRAGSLTPEKLLHASHRVKGMPNLHVLFGNMLRDQAEFFTPEEADHLLAVAASTYSLVTLDLGAYWDNAATVCSLRRADARMLVTTGALSHFQEDGKRWIGQVSPLFGIPPEAYEAIIIHPPWKNGGYSVKDICKEMGLTRIGELRLTESLFSQLDSGRIEEWLRSDEQGRKAMRETADAILGRYGIARRQAAGSQSWYRKLLAYRNGAGS
jgi:hypothetical protein